MADESTAEKEQLECAKLRAEIAKLDAETRSAEAHADRSEYEKRERDAGADKNGIYHFHSAVTENSVDKAIKTLDVWSRRDPGCDLEIVLNSPGGSVIDGLALYDFILDLRGRGHHVTTKALGYAASMGGILLQAGDKRIVGRHAYVLIHEVSKGAIGSLTEIEESLEFGKRLQDRLLAILAERSTMTVAQIKRKWKKTDWWLDAEESTNLGFADEIG